MSALLLQVVLIFLNAVFASAEIAVISVSDAKLAKLEEDGNKKAKKLKKLTSLPLIVANSHLHPDHSNGNFLFESVFVGEADLPERGMPSNDLARGVAVARS